MLTTDQTSTTYVSLPIAPMTDEAACRRAEGFATLDEDEATCADLRDRAPPRHGPLLIIAMALGRPWVLIGVLIGAGAIFLVALAGRLIP